MELVRKDGRLLYVNSSIEAIYHEGKMIGIIAITTDLSERKRVEQNLRQALEKEKELVALKNQIITLTSHEFHTPLSAMISSAELLEFYSHKWSEDK